MSDKNTPTVYGERGAERHPPVRIRAPRPLLIAAADVPAFGASIVGALWLRFGFAVPHAHLSPYLWLMPVLVAWRLFTAHAFGLYDFRRRLTLTDHVFGACGAAACGSAAGYGLMAFIQLYQAPGMELSRLAAGLELFLQAVWLLVSRRAVLAYLRHKGYRVRVRLMGSPGECRELADEIRIHTPRDVELAGMCPIVDGGPGQAAWMDDPAKTGPVDQVILVDGEISQQTLARLFDECDRLGADLYLFPGLNLTLMGNSRVTSIGGLPLIPLRSSFVSSPYRPIKRLLDTAAATAVLVVSSPLVLAAVLAIRIESRGPALFAQERLGLNGRPFRLFKLRTMVAGAEAQTGPALAGEGDPRVTRVGRVLRRFRIDEIPQLWNVVRGDMSLVGPRPERPEFAARFAAETPLYARRFAVKPGMTGLAQIHGRYDTAYAQKLRYDLIYANSVSLGTDLRILVATARTILTGHGAR